MNKLFDKYDKFISSLNISNEKQHFQPTKTDERHTETQID